MAKQRVMIVGGGLAGLAAAMQLAELGIDVDLMSLTPVKRSHSVCAQGRHQQRQRASRASRATTSGCTSTTPSTAATFCSTSRRSRK